MVNKQLLLAILPRIVGYATVILGYINTLPGHDTNPKIGIAIAALGFIIAACTDLIRMLQVPAAPSGTQYVVTTKDTKPVTAGSLSPVAAVDAKPPDNK